MDVTEARAHISSTWLVDRCTIRSPGVPRFDDDLGVDVVDDGAVVYGPEGSCRLRPTGGERVVMVGDSPVSLRTYTLDLDYDATGLKVSQLATMDVSSDPHMVDRRLRVVDVEGGTDSVYRRLIVEDELDVDEGDEEVGS